MALLCWELEMRVRATVNEGYIFSLDYWERQHWYTSGLASMKPTALGYTFSGYENVPKQMVEGQPFLDTIQPRTRSILCAEDFLEELGYTLNVYSGEFIKIEDIVSLPVRTIGAVAQFRYEANHLPQLHYPIGDSKIVAIDGEFDLSSRVFKGVINFILLD